MRESDCLNAGDFCKRGYDNYCQNNYHAAVLDFSQAIQLRPDCGAAYNNRANIFLLLGYTHSALKDFSIAAGLGFPVDVKNLKPGGQTCLEFKDIISSANTSLS